MRETKVSPPMLIYIFPMLARARNNKTQSYEVYLGHLSARARRGHLNAVGCEISIFPVTTTHLSASYDSQTAQLPS